MSKEDIVKEQMENIFKILSAIFDSKGGTITLDKKDIENAGIRFHITAKADGDTVVLSKVEGESDLYRNHFASKN